MYSISAPVGDSGMTPSRMAAGATPDSQRLAKAPSWRSRTAGALGPPQPSLGESTPTKSDAANAHTRGSEENVRLGSRASVGAMTPSDSDTLSRAMTTMLTSKDFRARIEGLQQMQALATTGPLSQASDSQVMAMLDSLTVRRMILYIL